MPQHRIADTLASLSVIRDVLKRVCREHEVERDRRAVTQISTLLMRLWNEGIRDSDELAARASADWREVAGIDFSLPLADGAA